MIWVGRGTCVQGVSRGEEVSQVEEGGEESLREA